MHLRKMTFSPLFSRCAAVLATVVLTACGSDSSGAYTPSQNMNALPHAEALSQPLGAQFIPSMDNSNPLLGAPAIVNGWVSLSFYVNGVPCINCVGSPPISGALGIAFPAPYLPLNSAFEITYTFYNVSKGSSACSLTFDFKQGTTDLFNHTYSINLNGNGQYVYFTAAQLPSQAVAGSATVSAGLKCGSFTAKTAKQTVYLH